ncbi:hypothetical protein HanRHA438_Chr17g0834561 [Helianthus annuus]|nr:hypothetical protein HanRHA438_Chr17g0834561 [Helianthus annuus]
MGHSRGSHGLQNHGHMCTVEIKARYSTNDLNGSMKSINTHHSFTSSSHKSDLICSKLKALLHT